jgi:hypothetical protein
MKSSFNAHSWGKWVAVPWLATMCLVGGCVRTTMPDPSATLKAYEEATARGDADALYKLLTEKSKKSLGKEGVKRALKDAKKELHAQAKAVNQSGSHVESEATVKFGDGETATLKLEDQGQFRISSADALPSGATTPAQALEQLRKVLARRSYAGLMRVLSKETQSAIEKDLRSLVEGLENPESLNVTITGDEAIVTLEGGHFVHLHRQGSIWKIDDFD